MLKQIFLGGGEGGGGAEGVNKVYYGRCGNGEFAKIQ